MSQAFGRGTGTVEPSYMCLLGHIFLGSIFPSLSAVWKLPVLSTAGIFSLGAGGEGTAQPCYRTFPMHDRLWLPVEPASTNPLLVSFLLRADLKEINPLWQQQEISAQRVGTNLWSAALFPVPHPSVPQSEQIFGIAMYFMVVCKILTFFILKTFVHYTSGDCWDWFISIHEVFSL